jgi:hypothetical protein
VLKNFFYHTRLVNEADDTHLALAFGTNKRVCLLSNEVGPAPFNSLDTFHISFWLTYGCCSNAH